MVAEVAQGLLENTSPSALSQLEVLLLSQWQGSCVEETAKPVPAQGPPVVLGAVMRLKHGNNATSASERYPHCLYLLSSLPSG